MLASRASRRLAVLALLACGLIAAAYWLFRGREVTIALPTRGDAAEVVYATGTVEPRLWAKVVALQRRRITDMCDCEGKAVKKGETLARLDDLEEQAALHELQARHDRLKEDADRLRGLVERNVSSRVTYDDKMTQIREYEARLTAQRSRIRDLELRAPMDGVVLRKDGQVGEIAGTGANDVLFWVGQPKPLRISAEVNEEDIAKIKPGQSVLLRHDGFPDGPLVASVEEITPKGDPSSKTFRVYFMLPDDTPLKIGMSVEANVIVREVKDALLVPAEAVENGAVWLAENGRLRRASIKTGIKSARMVEVVSGLAAGAAVVVSPQVGLRDGMRVRATNGTAK